jgi:hypothetical protein
MKIIFICLSFFVSMFAQVLDTNITPFSDSKKFERITFLDQKILIFKDISNIKFSEISDLAYDKRAQRLYFVGDKGKLFVFRALFSDKIDTLEPISAAELVKGNADAFASWDRDSEGLALNCKNQLFISFEGRAKIGRFDTKGRMTQSYALPLGLRDPKNYRSRNKSLEALAWHHKYGLLTAAEWPLKHMKNKDQTIYSLGGQKWNFKAEQESRSGVVAIEVMDDGNVMVMERSFSGIFEPFVVTLKKVYLDTCNNKQMLCKSEVLLKMNSHKGWKVDNFEGLARVSKHRYVMVSDDNDNFFQQTLLVYFEVDH